jgi:nitrogen regulatory protein P-II 1
MKLITAVIRPEKLADVEAALSRAGVAGMTLSRVQGHGGEGAAAPSPGAPPALEFVEKVRLDIAVSEPFVEPAIEAIIASARTGGVGDGKIFVQSLERVIRIRTGEQDVQALTRTPRPGA